MAAAFGDPNYMFAFAGARTADTEYFIESLQQALQGASAPTINAEFATVDAAPGLVTGTMPALQDISWTVPGLPGGFQGLLDISNFLPSAFDKQAPVLSFGVTPVFTDESVPAAPGVNLDIALPNSPTINMPAPPSLLSIQTYQFDGINIPDFTEAVPDLSIFAPQIQDYTPGAKYTSNLLISLQDTLAQRIADGSIMPASVEQAIWDRNRDREYRQLGAAIADLDRMESLGYAFPPGVYIDARLKLQTEFGAITVGASREAAITQAQLLQENIKHALTTATQLESTLVNYTNQIEQRLFEAAKYITSAGVEIYNARVKAYATFVETYRVKAAIYDTRIKGLLAKVEAYKAEVQAEQAKAQINTAAVEQYSAMIRAALAGIEVYKYQIDAARVRAEIEKVKVEVFGEQVRAYTAKVNAYTARVEGFKASVSAEATKQEAFKASVEAYGTQVEAQAKVIDAKIREFEAQIKNKSLEWDGYKAAVTGAAAQASAIASQNTAAAEVYKAEVQGLASYNEVLSKQWQVAIEQSARKAEINVAAAKASGELYQTFRSLAMDAAKVGAQVNAQLGAAALNAVNWSSSISTSTSQQQSSSTSSSTSTSMQTIDEHSQRQTHNVNINSNA